MPRPSPEQLLSSRRGSPRRLFEVAQIAGTATAGLRKDVVMLGGGYQAIAIHVLAGQPGASLLRFRQLHMDYGFMALLRVS
ncbi:cupredoxin domain-containing protein [Nocardia beijingensis]|uniref:hypothetical protein n=1 Tax=Nocardia beijingensis TaxID=95162 RepID=UPI00340EC32B